MQYYNLKNSTGDDIGKDFPQANKLAPGYPFGLPTSVSFLPNLKLPREAPNLDYLILSKKAKLTDFISTGFISAIGFLVSENVNEILKKFNSSLYHLYPARVQYKSEFFNYYWLHIGVDYIDFIDYQRSSFALKNMPPWDIPNWNYETKEISVGSKQELLNAWKENNVLKICPKKITLIKDSADVMDIVTFSALHPHVLISERLKEALLSNDINGIEFPEIDFPSFLNSATSEFYRPLL